MEAPENIKDYRDIARVKRDICFLYHKLAEYSCIMGDLDYSFYNLSYWEYLSCNGRYPHDKEFIRDGCLVMILAMAWEQIDGAGCYINDKLDNCRRYISYLEPDNENTLKLIEIVLKALRTAEAVEEEFDVNELFACSQWVYKEYVEGYFRRKVNDFDSTSH